MVPKEGKGKYNLTVPEPYEFLKKDPKVEPKKTIREQKLLQMLKEKEDEIKEVTKCEFRANPIPRSTKEPRF